MLDTAAPRAHPLLPATFAAVIPPPFEYERRESVPLTQSLRFGWSGLGIESREAGVRPIDLPLGEPVADCGQRAVDRCRDLGERRPLLRHGFDKPAIRGTATSELL